MAGEPGDDRLRAEHRALDALRAASTILTFTSEGDPAHRYTITYRGHGACRASTARGGVEISQVHRVEIRLAFGYPEHAPDVRWLTPIMHPNVSYSGYVNLKEIGLDWTPEIMLDALCERLWDVARLAYVSPGEPSNYAAQKWLQEQTQYAIPLDSRPLRDIVPTANPNIVRYARRDGQSLAIADTPSTEVLFIDEHTPTPVLPRRPGDSDILYIE
jgi:hypothetical protein